MPASRRGKVDEAARLSGQMSSAAQGLEAAAVGLRKQRRIDLATSTQQVADRVADLADYLADRDSSRPAPYRGMLARQLWAPVLGLFALGFLAARLIRSRK